MSFRRREFLQLAAGAAAFPALPDIVHADTYPSHPVRVIVGYGAGSAPDVVARLFTYWLSDRTRQQFVVENKPGAGTNISTETVVRAAPDGYTLLAVATPNMITNLLHANLSFDFVRDIAPIGCVGATPFVVITNPDFPPRTIPELIAYAKANPGKVNFTSNGTGNLTHITGELFKMMAGVDLFHVPAHGEVEAQADLLAGRVQVMFDPIISAIGFVRDKRLRALAVTTKTRVDALPDVPAVAEFVPGFEVVGWLGFGAPAGTPADVIGKLNAEITAGVNDAEIKSRLLTLGNVPTPTTPDGYRKIITDDIAKWAEVIKFADIKLD
jgi:tripartite-type tricarboxylate transporter receptor subunit TctC